MCSGPGATSAPWNSGTCSPVQAPPTNAAGRPVLYAGRYAPGIREAGTPDGFVLLDTQFLTEHLASLGAIEISADHYERLLARALALTCRFD